MAQQLADKVSRAQAQAHEDGLDKTTIGRLPRR
jgi:hypothetical protein